MSLPAFYRTPFTPTTPLYVEIKVSVDISEYLSAEYRENPMAQCKTKMALGESK
jgi:hypothetical protein